MQTQGMPPTCQKKKMWELWDEIKTNLQTKVCGEFNLHKRKIMMVSESGYGAQYIFFPLLQFWGITPIPWGEPKASQFKIYT
jgi:hypothetical protein